MLSFVFAEQGQIETAPALRQNIEKLEKEIKKKWDRNGAGQFMETVHRNPEREGFNPREAGCLHFFRGNGDVSI